MVLRHARHRVPGSDYQHADRSRDRLDPAQRAPHAALVSTQTGPFVAPRYDVLSFTNICRDLQRQDLKSDGPKKDQNPKSIFNFFCIF